MRRRAIRNRAAGWAWSSLAGRRRSAVADEPRFNQIQVIGTHNSYHIAPAAGDSGDARLAQAAAGRGARLHPSPVRRAILEAGIRQVELDVYADPKGGLFAEPAARAIVRALGKDPGATRTQTGRSTARPEGPARAGRRLPTTAPTFVDALKQIRAWSQANRRHVPILILVELKEDALPGLPTRPVPFGKDEIDAVDAEILSVFEQDRDPDARPGARPVRDPARGDQGPGLAELDDVRGLVMFALDNEGAVRDRYLEGHPALEDRVMFATVAPEHPAAAWFKINDPIKDFDRIKQLVSDGFLVRTRADADTVQSRKNDVTQRDKALASGAQFVSTDYARARPAVLRLLGALPRRPGRAVQPRQRRPLVGGSRSGDRQEGNSGRVTQRRAARSRPLVRSALGGPRPWASEQHFYSAVLVTPNRPRPVLRTGACRNPRNGGSSTW